MLVDVRRLVALTLLLAVLDSVKSGRLAEWTKHSGSPEERDTIFVVYDVLVPILSGRA